MKIKLQVDIKRIIERNDLKTLKILLSDQEATVVYEMIEELEPQEKGIVFRLLSKEIAAQVFSELEPDEQLELISLLKDDLLKSIIGSMDLADRAELLDEMPTDVVSDLLQYLTPDERKRTLQILNYPDNSAGRLMTSKYVYVKKTMSVNDALQKLRKFGKQAETVYTLFVTEEDRKLIGTVELKDLVFEEPHNPIEAIYTRQPFFVHTLEDQENVASVMRKHDLSVIPVVDLDDHIVGIITIDDIIDIIDEEATEDIQKMAGLNVTYTSYFHTTKWTFIKKRLPWLGVLLLIESMNSFIVANFESLIAQIPILAAFMTTMVDAGRNTGSQISALLIRGMAMGEVKLKDWWKVVSRELVIGLILGVILGIVLFLRSFFITGNLQINAIASFSLVTVIVFSNILGVILPFFGKLLHIDPAIMAGPLITTIVDISGVGIYLLIARSILKF